MRLIFNVRLRKLPVRHLPALRLFVLCFAFAGCGDRKQPLPAEPIDLSMTQVTAVRLSSIGIPDCHRLVAYSINVDQEHADGHQQLIVGGRLNPNREPVKGVELNDSQINRFLDSATVERPSIAHASCFYPHHGIAFLDSSDEMIGHYTICLMCYGKRASVGQFSVEPNYDELAILVRDLGLPDPFPAKLQSEVEQQLRSR